MQPLKQNHRKSRLGIAYWKGKSRLGFLHFTKILSVQWLFMVGLAFWTGGIFDSLGSGLFAWVQDFEFQHFSDVASGQIIDHRQRVTGDKVLYYITYRFISHDASYIREQTIDEQTYVQLENNTSVTVEYLPDQPNISRLKGVYIAGGILTHGWEYCLSFIFAPVAIMGLFLGSLRAANQVLDLYQLNRLGDTVQGEIVKHRVDENDPTAFFVTHRFYIGEQAFDKETEVSKVTYTRLIPKSIVVVKYLALDPRVSRLAGPESREFPLYGYRISIMLTLVSPLLLLLEGFLLTGRVGVVLLLLVPSLSIGWLVLRKRIKRYRYMRP